VKKKDMIHDNLTLFFKIQTL